MFTLNYICSMKSQLFIPEKCKVGFNPRTDTYSGKLGYVIAHDGKKWRKEPSWLGWIYQYKNNQETIEKSRNVFLTQEKKLKYSYENYLNDSDRAKQSLEEYVKKSIGTYENPRVHIGKITSDENLKPFEFENVPTEGFVLNRKVGGHSNGWNHRSTYCRVYDPRGFEFEISIPNLLFILQECNAYKGKGLEGSFVYSWDGKDLVLLPTSSLDYQESQKFTKLQDGKVGVKDLIEGFVYKDKNMCEWVYLGKFSFLHDKYSHIKPSISHVFYSDKSYDKFEGYDSLSNFVQKASDVAVPNYAELLSKFNDSKFSQKLNNVEKKNFDVPQRYDFYNVYIAFAELGNNEYQQYKIDVKDEGRYRHGGMLFNLTSTKKIKISDNGEFVIKKVPTVTLEGLSSSDLRNYNFKTLKLKGKKDFTTLQL